MTHAIRLVLSFILLIMLVSCAGQQTQGSPFTERLSEDFDTDPPIDYGMPSEISSIDTSAGWDLDDQKVLITGVVYEQDGRTPVSNVSLYYYQTDLSGRYSIKEGAPHNMPKNQLGQTHGYIRGWVKTGEDGSFNIYTVRPGAYPNGREAAHIHLYVKEPSMSASYYIDNVVFDDDPLLTTHIRRGMEHRGGSGVVRFVRYDNLLIGERNIILGLNIPSHPSYVEKGKDSGKSIGEELISFTPYHAYGADKGKKSCPICKYGWYHGILYFVGHNADIDDIRQWMIFLEKESSNREKYLNVFFVFSREDENKNADRITQLENIGEELNLENVALTIVPSFSDTTSNVDLNEIDPSFFNTILIYRRSAVIDKYLNVKPTQDVFEKISERLDETSDRYFKYEGVKG